LKKGEDRMSEGKEEEEKVFSVENTPSAIITREGHSVGKTEEYHRSNHTDFCNSKELKDREFSGVRHNSLSNQVEIWIDGDMRGVMSFEMALQYPDRFNRLYADVIGLKEVTSYTPEGN
jgi:hypothetical protein